MRHKRGTCAFVAARCVLHTSPQNRPRRFFSRQQQRHSHSSLSVPCHSAAFPRRDSPSPAPRLSVSNPPTAVRARSALRAAGDSDLDTSPPLESSRRKQNLLPPSRGVMHSPPSHHFFEGKRRDSCCPEQVPQAIPRRVIPTTTANDTNGRWRAGRSCCSLAAADQIEPSHQCHPRSHTRWCWPTRPTHSTTTIRGHHHARCHGLWRRQHANNGPAFRHASRGPSSSSQRLAAASPFLSPSRPS